MGCDKIISCLELCGCITIRDLKLLEEKNIRDIENYVSKICQRMAKEERKKYISEELIDFPERFMLHPFTKFRLFAAIADIDAIYNKTQRLPNHLSSITSRISVETDELENSPKNLVRSLQNANVASEKFHDDFVNDAISYYKDCNLKKYTDFVIYHKKGNNRYGYLNCRLCSDKTKL